MNSLQLMRGLFRHMEWADSIVWSAVFSSPDSLTDPNLKERLLHIHLVQHAFLNVWLGLKLDRDVSAFTEVVDIARWGLRYHSETQAYLAGLNDVALERPIILPWAQQMVQSRFGRDANAPSLGETLLQVNMHSAYHRGQVNARLRELGVEPPLTDYIAWIWLGRPKPEWPDSTS
jgi:uncharacterized damage-inducible protein DinB